MRTRVAGLEGVQWLIVLAFAGVLLAGVGWGLPTMSRVRILCHGTEVSGDLLARLDASLDSYLVEREAADSLSIQQLREGVIPVPYHAEALGQELDKGDRLRAFRRFLVSSSAVDEREPYIALARINPGELDFDLKGFIYGGAFLYPLGGLLFLLNGASVLHLDAAISHYLSVPEDAGNMYVAGRLLGVSAFLGVLVLLGMFGQAARRPSVGTGAMLTWGFSTLPLNQAVVTKPHVWTAFWVLFSIYLLYRYLAGRRTRELVLSALALGVAIGSNIFASVVLLVYPVVLMDRRSSRGGFRKIALAWGLSIATFGITNPAVLMSPESYLVTVLHHGSGSAWGYAVPGITKGLVFLKDVLLKSYAFPLSLLGAGTVVFTLVRGDRVQRRFAAAWIAAFLVLGFLVGVTRIVLFLGPPLCLFAGAGVDRLHRLMRSLGVALRGGVLTAFFAPAICFAGLFAYDVIRDDAWLEPTKEWIEKAQLGEGKVVGLYDHPEPRNTPPIPFLSCRIVNLRVWEGGSLEPDYVLLGNFLHDRRDWESHPIRDRYRLLHVLGYRESFEWFLGLRTRSEPRIAGWVFERVADANGRSAVGSSRIDREGRPQGPRGAPPAADRVQVRRRLDRRSEADGAHLSEGWGESDPESFGERPGIRWCFVEVMGNRRRESIQVSDLLSQASPTSGSGYGR